MGRFKSILTLVLVMSIILIMPVNALGSSIHKFTDINNHWAKEEIEFMIDHNIINGYGDGRFKPDNNITNVEFYKIINHLLGYKQKLEVKFKDVKTSDWFYNEVAKSLAAGYIDESENINPNELITREEVARIIGIASKIERNVKGALDFKDHTDISLEAKAYAGALKENGYIEGYEDGSFGPKRNITRAEVVKILFNMIELEGFSDLKLEKPGTQSISLESEVVRLVNIEREKEGLEPLVEDTKLSNGALKKSEDMGKNNYFDHYSPNYGSPFDMMKKFGIQYSIAGENIAMGYPTAESVVEGWMDSPGHRANIMNPNFRKIGIGLYKSNRTNYWTQLFTD